ncbi:MAG TPA: thioesterase [Dermatophilaceae bacterium]|nr:thioesterase [Dermatophilaceae bacterium]
MAIEHFEHTVTEADTAAVLGSGDLPVLATPRLINWVERATFAVARAGLPEGHTTVGTVVRVEHLKGSPVGTVVTIRCSKPISDGRRLIFHVTAADETGEPIATGEFHRRVVDPERFMSRFPATPAAPATPDPSADTTASPVVPAAPPE